MSAFRFALQKSRLLGKAASCIQPFGWLLAFRGAKAKAKSQTKHTLNVVILEAWFVILENAQLITMQR
jgi:hypothetical protein